MSRTTPSTEGGKELSLRALPRDLLGELNQALTDISEEKITRAIILSGARPSFCAGMDLKEMAETVRFLTSRGIPVLGHVGLMPQSVNTAGGFRVQGRTDDDARRIRDDAGSIADAGAFAIVIENTVEPLARSLSEVLKIPTIGIGASPACDGQILVTEDIVGLGGLFKPRFVKRYAELGKSFEKAIEGYKKEVLSRQFPAEDHCATNRLKVPRLATISSKAKNSRGA